MLETYRTHLINRFRDEILNFEPSRSKTFRATLSKGCEENFAKAQAKSRNCSPKDIYEMSSNTYHPDLKEECGVCGIFAHRDSARLVYLGLTALQHRGQESAGIVSFNGKMNRHVGMGLVFDVFKKEHFHALRGHSAIGHVRYSTHGSSIIKNAQPLLVSTPYGQVAVGHNGNFTNAEILKKKLELGGAIYQTTTDTEIILHLIARSKKKNLPEAILHSLKRVEGAYSLLFACDRDSHNKPGSMMLAVRDPYGFRPLVLGRLGTSWVVASETCAFDLIGAKTEREIEPGEMIIIENNHNYKSVRLAERPTRSSMCIFEFIYFARPDSKI